MGIIEKYSLSPNELFCIRAILMAQDEEDDGYNYFVRYIQLPENVRGSLRELLISLQNKGIILKSYKIPEKGDSFDVFDVDFNKNFIKQIYRASFEMGQELFENYPQFALINGMQVPLRSVSRKFDSLEDAFRYYGKCIRWDNNTHQEILELLKWAKDRNVLNCSLCSFLIDHKWIDLKSLKEGDDVNVNYDAIKMI